MLVTRHIEFEIKGDLTCVGTTIEDFSTDNLKEYNFAIEDYISDCGGSDFIHSFPVKIKRVWYEVEKGEAE